MDARDFGGVIDLFQSISLVQPSGLALPPNIWNRLYSLRRSGLLADSPDAADAVLKSWFGPFVKEVITGGAPPSPATLPYPPVGAAHVVSYRRARLIWHHGDRRSGRPAAGVQVKLVDVPELGLCHPYGEIWVLKPSDKR